MKKTIAILAAPVMTLTAAAGCSAEIENDNGGGSTTPSDASDNGGDSEGETVDKEYPLRSD